MKKYYLSACLIMILLSFIIQIRADERAKNAELARSNGLWFLTRGGTATDEGWGVDVDLEGNIYFATFQGMPLQTDIFLYKISPDGEQIWQTHWGGPTSDQAFEVVVKEPYVYVGGLSFAPLSIINTAMLVLAFNTANGDTAWSFSWNPTSGWDEADGLIVEDDYIYISGWTNGFAGGSGQNKLALVKLNLQGDSLCTRVWGSSGWDEANGQIVTDAENIYVAGRYNANQALGGDALLAAFSKDDLSYINHTTWGGTQGDVALGMTSDGSDLYLVGLTNSFGYLFGQLFLLKYDKSLNLIWETFWGGPNGETAREITIDSENQLLVAGATNSYGSGGNDLALLRFSATEGQLLNATIWGGTGEDLAHGLVVDGDYAYIGAETGSFGAGGQDALLLKTNYFTGEFPSAIDGDNEKQTTITRFQLKQNFPNPFNTQTCIRFDVPWQTPITLKIYDILGNEVTTLLDEILPAGNYSLTWEADNCPGGLYFYRFQIADFRQIKKMLLIK